MQILLCTSKHLSNSNPRLMSVKCMYYWDILYIALDHDAGVYKCFFSSSRMLFISTSSLSIFSSNLLTSLTLFSFSFPFSVASGFRRLMILAGLPATTQFGGTSFVTTDPAPTTDPFPIVTPASTITFPHSQQSSPIVMGAPNSGPFVPFLVAAESGCVAA